MRYDIRRCIYRSVTRKLEKHPTDNWSATDENSRACSLEWSPEIYNAQSQRRTETIRWLLHTPRVRLSNFTTISTQSKKQYTWLLIITLANLNRFTKFFHYQIPEEIMYIHVIKILHLTLSVFLHYLANLDNYNCSRFQWHIACETSEFILQGMRLH